MTSNPDAHPVDQLSQEDAFELARRVYDSMYATQNENGDPILDRDLAWEFDTHYEATDFFKQRGLAPSCGSGDADWNDGADIPIAGWLVQPGAGAGEDEPGGAPRPRGRAPRRSWNGHRGLARMTPDELRVFRKRYGLTQQALSDRLQVALRTVKHWESGAHPISPTAAVLLKSWARRKALPK